MTAPEERLRGLSSNHRHTLRLIDVLRRNLQFMQNESPNGSFSLLDVHQRALELLEATVVNHGELQRARERELAAKPVSAIVGSDGKVTVL